MAHKRNSACYCGSGRKYKHCHHSIDQAPPERQYEAGQAVYIRNWGRTAQAHYQAKRYHWMAERLIPFAPKQILDIGCGSGHGLLALQETFAEQLLIVAVDENGACLDLAQSTLSSAGISAEVIKRLETYITENGYMHPTPPIHKVFEGQCTLIEADICNDQPLTDALLAMEKFDAVTVWLTGTHMMRQFNANVRRLGIQSDGAHRLYVQNTVYELADKILRSGGVLQIVDRGEAPESALLYEDLMKAHREQASVTSLQVCDLEYIIYEEPNTKHTPMVFTPGKSGRIPEKYQTAIISIVSTKP